MGVSVFLFICLIYQDIYSPAHGFTLPVTNLKIKSSPEKSSNVFGSIPKSDKNIPNTETYQDVNNIFPVSLNTLSTPTFNSLPLTQKPILPDTSNTGISPSPVNQLGNLNIPQKSNNISPFTRTLESSSDSNVPFIPNDITSTSITNTMLPVLSTTPELLPTNLNSIASTQTPFTFDRNKLVSAVKTNVKSSSIDKERKENTLPKQLSGNFSPTSNVNNGFKSSIPSKFQNSNDVTPSLSSRPESIASIDPKISNFDKTLPFSNLKSTIASNSSPFVGNQITKIPNSSPDVKMAKPINTLTEPLLISNLNANFESQALHSPNSVPKPLIPQNSVLSQTLLPGSMSLKSLSPTNSVSSNNLMAPHSLTGLSNIQNDASNSLLSAKIPKASLNTSPTNKLIASSIPSAVNIQKTPSTTPTFSNLNENVTPLSKSSFDSMISSDRNLITKSDKNLPFSNPIIFPEVENYISPTLNSLPNVKMARSINTITEPPKTSDSNAKIESLSSLTVNSGSHSSISQNSLPFQTVLSESLSSKSLPLINTAPVDILSSVNANNLMESDMLTSINNIQNDASNSLLSTFPNIPTTSSNSASTTTIIAPGTSGVHDQSIPSNLISPAKPALLSSSLIKPALNPVPTNNLVVSDILSNNNNNQNIPISNKIKPSNVIPPSNVNVGTTPSTLLPSLNSIDTLNLNGFTHLPNSIGESPNTILNNALPLVPNTVPSLTHNIIPTSTITSPYYKDFILPSIPNNPSVISNNVNVATSLPVVSNRNIPLLNPINTVTSYENPVLNPSLVNPFYATAPAKPSVNYINVTPTKSAIDDILPNIVSNIINLGNNIAGNALAHIFNTSPLVSPSIMSPMHTIVPIPVFETPSIPNSFSTYVPDTEDSFLLLDNPYETIISSSNVLPNIPISFETFNPIYPSVLPPIFLPTTDSVTSPLPFENLPISQLPLVQVSESLNYVTDYPISPLSIEIPKLLFDDLISQYFVTSLPQFSPVSLPPTFLPTSDPITSSSPLENIPISYLPSVQLSELSNYATDLPILPLSIEIPTFIDDLASQFYISSLPQVNCGNSLSLSSNFPLPYYIDTAALKFDDDEKKIERLLEFFVLLELLEGKKYNLDVLEAVIALLCYD